jgi:ABC-type branched-subunit amino acid transport system substrate-binding protein
VIVVVVCLLSAVTVTRPSSAVSVAAGGDGGSIGPGDATDGAGTIEVTGDGAGGGSAGSAGSNSVTAGRTVAGKAGSAGTNGAGGGIGADCQGHNDGATDVGVSGNSINFAATVVRTGIAKDFLFDAQYGIAAVQRQVNASGGICGRLINIHMDDDGWDPTNGEQLIEKYIACKCYFGLAVNPSSEGLRSALDGGLIDQSQFPVVGSDGMLIDQYQHPWIWPVATSTHSAMHVIADEAFKRGARNVAIVYEKTYRFGVEGNAAFVGEAKRLGMNVVVDQEEQGGQPSYSNDASRFVGACSNANGDWAKCDFVALLLEPGTANQWVRNGGLGDGTHHPAHGIGAPQPLFVNSFANDCGAPCNGLQVWTGFKPPISPFDTDPAVAAYKQAVERVSSSADTNNPSVEGAYQGMLLLVQALKQLGGHPTRAGLKSVLDATTLDTGLGPSAQFRAGNHFAATGVQGFLAVYNGNSFVGWRYSQSGFLNDNSVNQDLPGSG